MLVFTVIEIAPADGYTIIRVQVSSTHPQVSTGDCFGIAVDPSIADLNAVGQPLVLPPVEE